MIIALLFKIVCLFLVLIAAIAAWELLSLLFSGIGMAIDTADRVPARYFFGFYFIVIIAFTIKGSVS